LINAVFYSNLEINKKKKFQLKQKLEEKKNKKFKADIAAFLLI
jgi:hypothetical protein